MSFSRSKRGSSGSVTTEEDMNQEAWMPEDEARLTTTFGGLLLFLPNFFGACDEILALVLCMVNFLLVMGFLQRPSVPNAVEHATKKSSISDDLNGRSGQAVCREWTGTDVYSWSCHDQV